MGELIEFNETKKIFTNPDKQQTENYITGRFGLNSKIMLQVENEIQELRDQLIEMWDLTIKQLDKTESAIKNFERDLALEVQQTEQKGKCI